MNKIINHFKDWTIFEKVWLTVFTFVNVYLFFTWKDSWMGLVASLTGMLCVVLAAKGKRSNYWVGIINILFYSYISLNNKYYGEVMLNMLWFLPMSIYGLWVWGQHKLENTTDNVKILMLTTKQRIILALLSVALIIGYAFILRLIKGNLVIADSGTTILQAIAFFLMARRYMEQWILWLIVDIGAVFMWVMAFTATGNDVTILIMWTAYLVNAFYGTYNWIKMYKEQNKTIIQSTDNLGDIVIDGKVVGYTSS